MAEPCSAPLITSVLAIHHYVPYTIVLCFLVFTFVLIQPTCVDTAVSRALLYPNMPHTTSRPVLLGNACQGFIRARPLD